jgi:hypothetical protein
MRLLCSVLFLSVFFAMPASAQSTGGAWELGLGPHVVYRDDSSAVHFGGGVTVARRYERFAITLEGSGTRREGHNDWRVIAGPRWMFNASAKASFFLQALAGTAIRQNEADWAVSPGAGFDVRSASGRAVRFLVDVPVERAQSRTNASVRGSVWFVF